MKYIEILQAMQQIIFMIYTILCQAHLKEMGLYKTKIPQTSKSYNLGSIGIYHVEGPT